jgi:ribosome-binding factor A
MMLARKPSRRVLRALCGEVHSEDGVDPRRDNRHRAGSQAMRKARRLCQQVADTLSLVLDDGSDDLLGDLTVLKVDPAPTTARLLVRVAAICEPGRDPAQFVNALERAAPRLRCEVAAAITRRKAPILAFQLCLRGIAQSFPQGI